MKVKLYGPRAWSAASTPQAILFVYFMSLKHKLLHYNKSNPSDNMTYIFQSI